MEKYGPKCIKIERSKIVTKGITIKGDDGETRLILQGEMPLDCVVLFIDKEHWLEIKDRRYN